MDRLIGQFRKKITRSKSVDLGSNHLKWLTFSSNPVSLLPVFLGSEDLTETETLKRASSIDVLTSSELSQSMDSATLSRSGGVQGAGPGHREALGSGQPAGPFKATLLWEKIVLHLEGSIKCGRHAHKLKIYDKCFRGAQAVACLSTYLNAILPRTVSREQVLTLCQKLVMTGVMEDVKDEEASTFKEGHLYRFSKYHFWEASVPGHGDSPTVYTSNKLLLIKVSECLTLLCRTKNSYTCMSSLTHTHDCSFA